MPASRMTITQRRICTGLLFRVFTTFSRNLKDDKFFIKNMRLLCDVWKRGNCGEILLLWSILWLVGDCLVCHSDAQKTADRVWKDSSAGGHSVSFFPQRFRNFLGWNCSLQSITNYSRLTCLETESVLRPEKDLFNMKAEGVGRGGQYDVSVNCVTSPSPFRAGQDMRKQGTFIFAREPALIARLRKAAKPARQCFWPFKFWAVLTTCQFSQLIDVAPDMIRFSCKSYKSKI